MSKLRENGCIVLVVLAMISGVCAQTTSDKPIVVTITRDTTSIVHNVEGRAVRRDLLGEVGRLIVRRGTHPIECAVRFREDIPFSKPNDTRLLMSKAGCDKVRMYVFSKDEQWIQEITLGKVSQFESDR